MRTSAQFAELVRAYEPRVRGYCARRLPATAVDDTVAEVFAIAWRRREDIPEGDETLPWLYTVAYRVVGHEWRRAGRSRRGRQRVLPFMPVGDPGPLDQVVESEERAMVLHALSRLSEPDQEILRLTTWEELSLIDAAVVLGIKPNAAKQRVHRARRRLIDEFRRVERAKTIELVPLDGGDR